MIWTPVCVFWLALTVAMGAGLGYSLSPVLDATRTPITTLP